MAYAHGSTPVVATISGGTPPYLRTLFVGGVPIGTATNADPVWVTTSGSFPDGSYSIAVRVTDAAGATVDTNGIGVTVDNTPPSAFMVGPTAGAQLTGTVTLQVNASDLRGVKQVQFTVDGTAVGSPVTQPDAGTFVYSLSYDTSALTAAQHAIGATVTDNAGNTGIAPSVQVTAGTTFYLPVLNYHGIDTVPPDQYEVFPANADAQLAYLHDNGYTSITLEQYQQLLSGQNIGIAKPVLITVDDGMADQVAWDALLQKYGLKAVLFVVTGLADNTQPGSDPGQNMTWAQIQSFAANGRWQIGFHAGTYGHGEYGGGTKAGSLSYTAACPWFYSCLGVGEDVATFQSNVTSEVQAGWTRLKSQVPGATKLAWVAPFNDAGQWTSDYNDPSNALESWMPQFFASQFPIGVMQTSPVQYGQASGLVGSLTAFNRQYRFEVDTGTTLAQFAAALTDPAFLR